LLTNTKKPDRITTKKALISSKHALGLEEINDEASLREFQEQQQSKLEDSLKSREKLLDDVLNCIQRTRDSLTMMQLKMTRFKDQKFVAESVDNMETHNDGLILVLGQEVKKGGLKGNNGMAPQQGERVNACLYSQERKQAYKIPVRYFRATNKQSKNIQDHQAFRAFEQFCQESNEDCNLISRIQTNGNTEVAKKLAWPKPRFVVDPRAS